MGFIKNCIDTCLDSIFKAKISNMKYNDFINYLISRQNCKNEHNNIKIKESCKIVHKKISYHGYNNYPYDYHSALHTGHAYYVVFEYVILKHELTGGYSIAMRSITDNIWFTNLNDAEFYKKYAKNPSVTDSIDTGIDYQLMTFNNIDSNKYHLCAQYDKQFGCYYFFNGDDRYNSMMTLDLLLDEYGLYKNDNCDNAITIPANNENVLIKNDPKIQFLLTEEIERTEEYLKKLKRLV